MAMRSFERFMAAAWSGSLRRSRALYVWRGAKIGKRTAADFNTVLARWRVPPKERKLIARWQAREAFIWGLLALSGLLGSAASAVAGAWWGVSFFTLLFVAAEANALPCAWRAEVLRRHQYVAFRRWLYEHFLA
jgi:hypothetical protein